MVVEMAKVKKSRRLKRRIRKTLGALFLVSAITVAAIPVDSLQASTGSSGQLEVTLSEDDSGIPFIDENETIYYYADQTGTYQFAYVYPDKNQTQGNKVAVILGYSDAGITLTGGALTIPNTVDIYGKISDNWGSNNGYVAVGKNGNFLFYRKDTQRQDSAGNLLYEQKTEQYEAYPLEDGTEVAVDEYNESIHGSRKFVRNDDGTPKTVTDLQGNLVYVYEDAVTRTREVDDLTKPIVDTQFLPCFSTTRDEWGSLRADLSQFYTRIDESNEEASEASDFKLTTNTNDQWIIDVAVEYIGNQSLTSDGKAGAWITSAAVEAGSARGVFANNGSIRDLTVGSNLKGIGDYAFYYCTGLQSITLGNGLNTIGNHAFDSCLNFKTISIDTDCRLEKIGDHAFYNCQALESFVMPTPVQAIGDGAFENCYALTSIELYSPDRVTALNTIGDHAFKNCRNLTELIIPGNVTGNGQYAHTSNAKLNISMVEGCRSLKSITLMNEGADFYEDQAVYSFADFTAEVPSTFYFEGVNTADSNNIAREGTLHRTANDNSIAFKYLGSDVYEIVKKDATGKRAIYRVNSSNELIYCQIEQGMTDIDMPSTIGPYQITRINASSFQHNCFLERIKIPSSVTYIEDAAFQGCHQLRDVIFEEPVNLTYIGSNAFKTQDATVHQVGCPYSPDAANPSQLPTDPVLTFTGPISYSCVPFTYAMDAENYINVGSQNRTYITYYSGWPTNLTVQYNEETDKNELINYPTFNELSTYTMDSYPYMTADYTAAAKEAADKYLNSPNATFTDYERQIINSAVNIVLPQGIESVKEGLFEEKEDNDADVSKSITTNGIAEILPRTFKGCSNLTSLYIFGDTNTIGDYAFEDCENLETVEISANVTSMGVRPFAGCPNVSYVSFQGGGNFICEDSIIYGLSNGVKDSIVECLEARGNTSGSSTVTAEELSGITSIAKEAFYDCSGVGSVDLKDTSITAVPEGAFGADTSSMSTLYSVYLPSTCQQIQSYAFKNSAVRYVEIPISVSYIDPDAFNTNRNSPAEGEKDADGNPVPGAAGTDWERYHSITFYCEDTSNANIYAGNYDNINTTSKPLELSFTVYFWGKDGTLLDKQIVNGGEDAVPPEAPEIEGETFTGWLPSYLAVSRDLDIVAQYQTNDPEESKLTVTFLDYDDTVLKTDRVAPGADAVPPADPEREGYRFTGWRPAFTNVTTDMTVYAQYERIDSDEYKFDVTFVDYDDTVLKVDRVAAGEDAEPPAAPEREGYIFTGWRPDYKKVTEDMTVYAQYEPIDSDDQKFVVRFIDYDDNVLYTQRVNPGEDAYEPKDPEREGYIFTGWRPAITNVTSNLDTYAQYERIGSATPTPTPDPNATPTPTPNPNATPTPTPTPNPNATPTPTPNPNASPTPTPTPSTFYTLTVRNGSGSGSYVAGAQVIVIADNPENGMVFSNWTVDPSTAVVVSKDTMGTVLTMPASNVTMTANYKAGTGTGSNNNGSTGTGSNTNGGTGTTRVTPAPGSSNGTTVVINKNGLSNTGVVSVTVNGSSDNFVVKITEDAAATEAALNALMNEYSDLTNIKYFPMDISLYDSTGEKKITDTTGLSIDITLPIPDSLIDYAGNNKVAGVVNNRLDKLSPKFTTISGVPCITFTATHFSPYVIYVDTSNLSAGVIQDSTPKTGDGIHPKWFLSIGLACISVVLFMKKDKRNVPVKAKAAR